MIHQDIKAASAAGASCLHKHRTKAGPGRPRRRRGGLSGNRTDAIRFAVYECQRRPQSVTMLPDGLELGVGLGGDLNVSRKIQRAA